MRRSLALMLALSACGGPPGDDDESALEPVKLPAEALGGPPVLVLRTTNGATIDPQVYADVNRLFNEQVDLKALLMRGGLRTDDDGVVLPVEPDLAGTAIEQVGAFVADGGVAATAEDACGNPMIASFVTPAMVAEAGGALGDARPDACADDACDTLQTGIVEVVLSNVRFDGMLDVVVNVHSDVLADTPALWGHLIATYLSADHPGFLQTPVVLNAKQFQLGLFNVLQRVKSYEHPGLGTREVIVLPHADRSFRTRDLLVTLVPPDAEECEARWTEDFGGVVGYGCRAESSVLVDTNSADGTEVWRDFASEGSDPLVLMQLQEAFAWQLQTAAVCAPVGEKSVYLHEGKVELFTCPPSLGDLDTCLAVQDLDEFACRPVEGTEVELSPLEALGQPFELVERREPYVLRNDPLTPGGGPEVELEITVDADTVLFLPRDAALVPGAARFTSIVGPSGAVTLPTPKLNEHCEEEPAFRYDVGTAWGPGTYTFTAPWTAVSEDLRVHVTSLETWKF